MATPPPLVAPVALEQYAGRYETPDATYDLHVEDDALVFTFELHLLPEQVQPALIPDISPRIPVAFIAEDLALATIAGLSTPIGFVRDGDGDIRWAAASARLVPKAETA